MSVKKESEAKDYIYRIVIRAKGDSKPRTCDNFHFRKRQTKSKQLLYYNSMNKHHDCGIIYISYVKRIQRNQDSRLGRSPTNYHNA